MTKQRTIRFPYIEDADNILRKIAFAGIEERYEGEQKQQAVARLEKELRYVKKQKSSGGYLTVWNALNSVDAKPQEFLMLGTCNASIIFYALGLSDFDPVRCVPKIYPEFFYGYNGERRPSFEFTTTQGLRERLLKYFRNYPGDDPVFVLTECDEFNPDNIRIFIGERTGEPDEYGFYKDTFWIGMSLFGDDEEWARDFLDHPITRACKPKTFDDCVRCYGLIHGTGTWEQNAELQLPLGFNLSEMITHREDVYEHMLGLHLGKRRSYRIAEDIRFGRLYYKRFNPENVKAFFRAGGEGWYYCAMSKILYLFPRAHTVAQMKRRWKMIEGRLK